ncbi:hypothetical protein JCM10908_002133 [Rhodotorula pacifica]|uniref:uncharacterized protein n=1 Tax=Rhodotorula pacifica TaxID=1495444 RepID=UPI00316E76F3
MTISGLWRIVNNEATTGRVENEDVLVTQTAEGIKEVQKRLDAAKKEREGSLHLIDVSTVVGSARYSVLQRSRGKPIAQAQAVLNRAASDCLANLVATIRAICPNSEIVAFVDNPSFRHALKRATVMERLVGDELRHLAKQGSDADGEGEHDEVQDEPTPRERADARKGGRRAKRKHVWSPLDLGAPTIVFPPGIKVVVAEHEADPAVARAAEDAVAEKKFKAAQVFTWSADSDVVLEAGADISGTLMKPSKNERLVFVDRVALEQSPRLARLRTRKSRLLAAILAGVDYHNGIPQHGFASVVDNESLVGICSRDWQLGEDDAFQAALAAALSAFKHKDKGVEQRVRSYQLSLETALAIVNVMTGGPVQAEDLFDKADLVEEAKAKAALEYAARLASRQAATSTDSAASPTTDGDSRDLDFPASIPARQPLPANVVRKPPAQVGRARHPQSLLGCHGGMIAWRGFDVEDAEHAQIVKHSMDFEWRLNDAEERERDAEKQAAQQDAHAEEAQVEPKPDDAVVNAGPSTSTEKSKRRLHEPDDPQGPDTENAEDDDGAAPVADGDGEDSGDEDVVRARRERQIKAMTTGAYKTAATADKPAPSLKDRYAITSRSTPIEHAFRRLAVPLPKPVQPSPPIQDDDAVMLDNEDADAREMDPRAKETQDGEWYYDGGEALRTVLDTTRCQHAYDAQVLVPILEQLVTRLSEVTPGHRWVADNILSGGRSLVPGALVALAALARTIDGTDGFSWPRAHPCPTQDELYRRVLGVEVRSTRDDNLSVEELERLALRVDFDKRWAVCPDEIRSFLAYERLPLTAYNVVRDTLAARPIRLSKLSTVRAAMDVFLAAYETNVGTALRCSARSELRKALLFFAAEPRRNVIHYIHSTTVGVETRVSLPPIADFSLALHQLSNGRRASQYQRHLANVVESAYDQLPLDKPLDENTAGKAAVSLAIEEWLQDPRKSPPASRTLQANKRAEMATYLATGIVAGLEQVRAELKEIGGTFAKRCTFGELMSPSNKDSAMSAAKAAFHMRSRRAEWDHGTNVLPRLRGSSLAFNVTAIFHAVRNFGDTAATLIENANGIVDQLQGLLDRIGKALPAHTEAWFGSLAPADALHRLYGGDRVIQIEKALTAEGKTRLLILPGLHDARVGRVLETPTEGRRIVLPRISVDQPAVERVESLSTFLGIDGGGVRSSDFSVDAASPLFSLLFRSEGSKSWVLNGTGVATAASVVLHYRDLRRPLNGARPTEETDAIASFNTGMKSAAKKTGFCVAKATKPLLRRKFTQLVYGQTLPKEQPSDQRPRLVTVTLPWIEDGQRGRNVIFAPGGNALQHDPTLLDRNTIRPLNYETSFLDARRMFTPLSATEEAETADDETEEREKLERTLKGAKTAAATTARNELEQQLAWERDSKILEQLDTIEAFDPSTIVVGVDPGEAYCLAATAFPPLDLPEQHLARAVLVRNSSVKELDLQAQEVALSWARENKTRQLLSFLTAARASLSAEDQLTLSGLTPLLEHAITTEPVARRLAYIARSRRESQLEALASAIAADVLKRYDKPSNPLARWSGGPPARKVFLVVGEKAKGGRTKSATGADRRWLLVPLLLRALNAIPGVLAAAFTVNEAWTTKSCPRWACRRSREGTKIKEKMVHPTRKDDKSKHFRILQCMHCGRVYHRDVAGSSTIGSVGAVQLLRRKTYLFGKAVKATMARYGVAEEESLASKKRKMKS